MSSTPPRSIGPAPSQARNRRWRRGKAPLPQTTNGSAWCSPVDSNHEIAAHKGGGFRCRWVVEKIRRGALLAQRAADQKNHISREPAELAEIVRGHHDLDAGLRRRQHDLFDAAGRRG